MNKINRIINELERVKHQLIGQSKAINEETKERAVVKLSLNWCFIGDQCQVLDIRNTGQPITIELNGSEYTLDTGDALIESVPNR